MTKNKIRMKRLLLLAAITAICGSTAAQNVPVWPEVKRETKAASRWWLMGSALDGKSVANRIGEYAGAGIGTLEITPIYGVQGNEANELGFLSTKWMEALRYTQAAAEAEGVGIDMNTGTGWPFGGPSVSIDEAAGQLVYASGTLTGDGATEQTLELQAANAVTKLNRVMAYPQTGNANGVTDVTAHFAGSTLKWAAPEGNWLVVAIFNGHTLQQVKRAAPGGEGYVLDHFDSAAVANYLKRFEDAFEKSGAAYPHSFFNDSYEVYNADWTPKMFEEFEKYRGYKLEDNMDKLLGLGTRKDTNNQVLADYRQTLGDMLLNNFTLQWTAWAHKHGATTRNQAHGSPANLIDIYAAVDIPEIEGFGLTDFGIKGLRTDRGFTRANFSDFATLKYASSAAHITGKPLTSSETFTWLTEHFRTSLSQMKPDMDLMFCAGVNRLFFHGTTYTPDGAAWPGWKFYASIDMSPTNSIWRDAPFMMKYIERCQSFLQMGQPDNDLLVYVPFHDAWHKSTGSFKNRLLTFPIDDVSAKLPVFTACVTAIEAAGLDCDYISDKYLLTTTYADGRLKTAAGTEYKGLVVPVDKYMPAQVRSHLDSLAAAGAAIAYTYDALTLASIGGAKPEALRTEMGLRMIRRRNGTGHHYFISNLSKNDIAGFAPLSVDFGSAVMFDPMTGATFNPVVSGGQVYFELKSGQSVILQTYAATDVRADSSAVIKKELNEVPVDGRWQLTFAANSYPQVADTYRLEQLSPWENLDGNTAKLMGTGIYTTTFTVSKELAQQATGGWRLDLGDVRESARVVLNGQELGCVWSAPFVLDCGAAVREGENTLTVEVTNLPANRIRQMDIDGTAWRIFKDVNILAIKDGNIGVSGVTSYADWEKMPSGLNSAVKLIPMYRLGRMLKTRLKAFTASGSEPGVYYPEYLLTAGGETITAVAAADVSGKAFDGYASSMNADGTASLVMRGMSSGQVVVTATTESGGSYQAMMPARGAYRFSKTYDFTSADGPDGGWYGAATGQLNGFDLKTEYRQARKMGKNVTDLYGGLAFVASQNNLFYFFPGYGMNMFQKCVLNVTAAIGDMGVLSYLVGDAANSTVYEAADSLTAYTECREDAPMAFDLRSRSASHVYRMLSIYTPLNDPTAIREMNSTDGGCADDAYYNLQGQKVANPQKGIYIRKGKKTVFN